MTRTVTVESMDELTPTVKQFRLVATDGEVFEFDPGQHTQIHFTQDGEDSEDGEEVVRPYTATNRPGTEQLTLAIRRYDDGTASVWMHDRERGDEIELEDLDGNLYLRDADEDVVFLSTGTGITPMIAMLKQYVDEGTGHAHFLYGEKTQEDIIYRETLDQLEAENENLTVTYSLSDEKWDGLTGHVQEHAPEVVDNLEERNIYVCGVPQMVVDTKELLDDEGVPEDHVFSEGWEGDDVSEE
ncbi:phenol hydroxylase [Haloprofundus marisrubri]|uniref:Phenol hydroxylase n=1 Tax=Haloprofundus marisrubri TaxID=1514971 RepID=A0A0W1RAA8_9EURY|nr:FAD-binding oxidoreductase [Haloprofundus marisrubri]KTG10283.1 phenol hydroxylase [Haloprofundus marisrubri]